jgi:hypothetical protein
VKHGEDECWGWTAGTSEFGYGLIGEGGCGGRLIGAHMVSWVIHFGLIPDGKKVLHECDNPPCTNPKHLFLGTLQDNVRDMVEKGRHAVGERQGLSILTEQQVEEIRFFHISEYTGKGPTSPCSTVFLARKYGVCTGTIKSVVRRSTWRHV